MDTKSWEIISMRAVRVSRLTLCHQSQMHPEIIKQLYETRPFSDDVMANNIAVTPLDWPIALPGGVHWKDYLAI